MKKLAVIIAFILVLCLILSACGVNTPPADKFGDDRTEDHGNTDSGDGEIKDPVIDWWKVYKNNNKTTCVTVQVSNPNSFPIGFSYDLVFYKNNEVVKTESMWAMTCIEPNKSGIIYGDIDIPSSTEVDSVVLENIEASKFEWKVLDSTFEKTFIDGGKQYFDVTFSDKPRQTEIWVALYNDTNKDKKIQAEEFVQMGLLAPFVGIYEKNGEIYIPVSDESLTFTDYQIYCLAFTMDKASQ